MRKLWPSLLADIPGSVRLQSSPCAHTSMHLVWWPACRVLRVQECLGHIIAALDSHPGEVDIQTKGLVLLGVLVQVGGCGAWAGAGQ